MDYKHIIATREGPVGLVQLNRAQALNALNGSLMAELTAALAELDQDPAIRCMIVTGNDRAFAAGADIKEMADSTPVEMLERNWIGYWDRLANIVKPVIAAVSGYALGGGCELAMACDIIVASETAQFGQPEINLAIIPGAGGTQRLTRALGKSKAMEMILTGHSISAREAEARGLVAKVVPVESFLDEAKAIAREIAGKAPVAVRMAKQAVNKSFELALADGIEYERNLFYLLFATEDQKEGMQAFIGKRRGEWKGK